MNEKSTDASFAKESYVIVQKRSILKIFLTFFLFIKVILKPQLLFLVTWYYPVAFKISEYLQKCVV